MATAHINIGSNIGDRHALIGQAVAAIERLFATEAVCSEPIESEPWGFDSGNRFVNVGLNIEVGEMAALDVFDKLEQAQLSVDASSHRDASGGYADRRIDIDLIAIGGLILDHPRLILPHPRMHLRRFVLQPMDSIWPDWVHPVLSETPRALLERL